jgi:hypothetical protein
VDGGEPDSARMRLGVPAVEDFGGVEAEGDSPPVGLAGGEPLLDGGGGDSAAGGDSFAELSGGEPGGIEEGLGGPGMSGGGAGGRACCARL